MGVEKLGARPRNRFDGEKNEKNRSPKINL